MNHEPQALETPRLPVSQESLEPEQCQALMDLLKKGQPVTNFEIQRALFKELNRYARNGIKSYLNYLEKEGLIVRTGQKRGTRYQLVSE